ncbi:MAG: hypothetical protein CL820_10845 [Croceicoccus sp.]|nr:hypothetical protein [Croceicoccus sp.]MAL26371.1 hypothetical protein [Croceicoccus sp.]|tara:strand:+ start:8114 stop:10345 length:2232 start_codon:yes stop_codon:yes gene_type:complete
MTGAVEKPIWPNLVLADLFSNPWIGFILAAAIIGLAGLIVIHNYWWRFRPLTHALKARLAATQIIAEQADDEIAQDAFYDNFDAINAAMLEGGKHASGLKHAWTQFSETIVDKNDNPLQATTRPDGYFLHLGDDTRVLAWWANLFVALGLTFTFLGIIGALSKAVGSMSGGDMAAMQSSLMELLVITAAKFWTSVGGVAASIILRMFDRRWHSATLKRLEALCERLEHGTLYSPPQRVAAKQLRELEQQSVALTEFSHQLAASIGDAMGRHLDPVVSGISGIQTSLNEFREGSFNQIGKELGAAISQNAGTEMAALADALTAMTGGLQGVNDRLEGASGEASEQIATAAREFSTASEKMTLAFGTLNSNLETMSRRISQETAEANERREARAVEERQAYDDAAERQRLVLQEAGEGIGAASRAASEAMIDAVQSSIREAMSESSETIRVALEGFAGATAGIQTAFDQVKTQIGEMGGRMSDTANDAALRNAQVLEKAAATLENVTGRAHTGMLSAIDDAIARSSDASARAIATAFEQFGEKFEQSSAGFLQSLAGAVGRMEALAQSIERSTGASRDHATILGNAGREAEQVGLMLGRAANDVSGATAPMRDAARIIHESVGHSQELLRRSDESGQRNLARITEIANTMDGMREAIERTSGTASQAWASYETRFNGVDEALAKALDQIRHASAEHAGALNTEVGRIDSALAKAVDKFASAVDDIKDLADALEDLRGGSAIQAAE